MDIAIVVKMVKITATLSDMLTSMPLNIRGSNPRSTSLHLLVSMSGFRDMLIFTGIISKLYNDEINFSYNSYLVT